MRVKKLILFKRSKESGVLIAMKNTKQGYIVLNYNNNSNNSTTHNNNNNNNNDNNNNNNEIGESGWYISPDSSIYYFVLKNVILYLFLFIFLSLFLL